MALAIVFQHLQHLVCQCPPVFSKCIVLWILLFNPCNNDSLGLLDAVRFYRSHRLGASRPAASTVPLGCVSGLDAILNVPAANAGQARAGRTGPNRARRLPHEPRSSNLECWRAGSDARGCICVRQLASRFAGNNSLGLHGAPVPAVVTISACSLPAASCITPSR